MLIPPEVQVVALIRVITLAFVIASLARGK
jgi:hypothetical protein